MGTGETAGFRCDNNKLTTLVGGPKEVGGSFYCDNNKLTTIEGCPREVGSSFYCYENKLTTLVGAPREVLGNFNCSQNNLTTLEGSPREVRGVFNCSDNNLTSLEGAPREVGGEFYFMNNNFPEYFNRFIKLNSSAFSEQAIIKQILKWQDDYELWKNPQIFVDKFKRMMVDIQEIDLPYIEIKFPEDD